MATWCVGDTHSTPVLGGPLGQASTPHYAVEMFRPGCTNWGGTGGGNGSMGSWSPGETLLLLYGKYDDRIG